MLVGCETYLFSISVPIIIGVSMCLFLKLHHCWSSNLVLSTSLNNQIIDHTLDQFLTHTVKTFKCMLAVLPTGKCPFLTVFHDHIWESCHVVVTHSFPAVTYWALLVVEGNFTETINFLRAVTGMWTTCSCDLLVPPATVWTFLS